MLYVIVDDISVMNVMEYRCAGGMKKVWPLTHNLITFEQASISSLR